MLEFNRYIRATVNKFKTAAGLTPAKRPADWRCFRIVDRKIAPPLSCELNAVDHCNIACLDCNHASPGVAENFADPDSVFNDFSRLAKVYQADCVKILGGEPLLHPDLISLIHAIRKSGVSEKIRLVTNGTLLHHMPHSIWHAIDQIEVSSYPETELKEDCLRSMRRNAAQHRVELLHYVYSTFRITFSAVGTDDDRLVRRIYRACKLANLWGCQSIYKGFFFKCPQSIYIPKLMNAPATLGPAHNGLKIRKSRAFYNELLEYLDSPEPLGACRYCLGSIGKHRPHRLVKKSEWKAAHQEPTEKLIDYEKLKCIESGVDLPDIEKARIDGH